VSLPSHCPLEFIISVLMDEQNTAVAGTVPALPWGLNGVWGGCAYGEKALAKAEATAAAADAEISSEFIS
jgi:hypothetical protein